jgi:exonuclease SbcD
LAFGFDEEGQEKSVSLIELAHDGTVGVTEFPIKPLRQVRTIRGKLLELLAATEVSNDLVRVVLTDEAPQIDPMKRIRALYPNAVQLAYERNERPLAQRLEEQRAAIDDPQALSSTFLEIVRGDPMSEAEAGIVASTLSTLATTEVGQ